MANGLPSVPIGTIVPFAGEIDPGWLEKQGWLYCNGASLNKAAYANLVFAIGTTFGGGRTTFNLPDLRGRFVRGVDLNAGRDPAVNSRTASNPGGLAGDNPGSVQPYLTAQPVTAFTATSNGLHHHPVPHAPVDNNAYAIAGSHYGIWNNDTATTSQNGAHSHSIEHGGNAESRPTNNYVFFIIKFDDPS